MNPNKCCKRAAILTYVWVILALIVLLVAVVSDEDRLLLAIGANILIGQAAIYSKLLKFEERFLSTDETKSENSEVS